jgi:Icc-related predicted phosphoesterase
MRIVCISDTHELHRELDVPPGDLLIHAGDFSFAQHSIPCAALRNFNEWLGELPHRYKVVVPGNHDVLLAERRNHAAICNATLLVNSGVVIEGVRIWGSPLTPLRGGAFTCADPEERQLYWARIPKGTDILVTHTPPFGVLDQTPDSDEHEGCPELWEAVSRVRPRYHVFGHVHGAHGILRTEHTTFINAALVGEFFDLDKRPIVFDF